MYYFEKCNLKMTGLYITYNAGAMYENDNQLGTMHLMEHMICKRFDDLRDELTKRDIVYNAYTDEEQVVVFFTGLSSQLTSDLKIELVKRLTDGIFATEDEFIKERDVVIQEYYNYFNDLQFGNLANYLRNKFNNYSIIGKADDINNFSYEDALVIFEKFFKKPSRIIESGKNKTDFSFVEYNDIPLTTKHIKYGNYNNEAEIVPESETNSVVIVSSKKPVTKRDYPIFVLLNLALCEGLNSPLYQELREKRGLIYSIGPDFLPCVNDSIFSYTALTTKENAEEVARIIKEVITNLDDYLTEARFEDIINNNLIKLETDSVFRFSNPQTLTKGFPSKFKTKKQYQNVTLKDAIAMGKKYFDKLEIVIS